MASKETNLHGIGTQDANNYARQQKGSKTRTFRSRGADRSGSVLFVIQDLFHMTYNL